MRTMLRSRLSLLFMSFALMLALPAMAFADQLANNIDDTIDGEYEAMALETGGKAKEAKIYIVATDDAQNNCNLNDPREKITVRVTSSATSVATAKWTDTNDRLIDFTGCGRDDGKMLKVTSGDAASEEDQKDSILPAEITFDITYDNTDRGNFNVNRAQFKVFTTKPSNNAPTVSITGVQAGASYEVGSVPTAGCLVADAEDANESATPVVGAVTGPLSADGIGSQTVTCSYTDGGGLTEVAKATYTINDTGAPSSSHQLSAAANANGWHNADVTVNLSGSDNGSGLKEIRYSIDGGASYSVYNAASKPVISAEGTTTFKYYAVDNAGNQQTEQSFTIKLDKTAPQATENQATTAPNAAGWYKTAVTNHFAFSDGNGSGLTNAADASIDKTTNSEGTSIKVNSGPVSDLAGNTNNGVDSAGFKIDKTAPSIMVGAATTQPNAAGWYKTDVTNNFSASDALSGVAAGQNVAADGSFTKSSGTAEGSAVLIASGTIADVAGNVAASKDAGPFKIDMTAPAVNCDSAPAAWSGSDVSIRCQPTDGLSGLANAADGDFNLSTSVANGVETSNTSTGSRGVADAAGNSVEAGPTTGIKVDKKAPALVSDGPSANPDGTNGWYKTAVTNGFTATDGGSGFGLSGALTKSFSQSSGTNEGAAVKIASGVVSDAVGNSNSGIDSAAFMIDLSDPSTPTFNGGPAAGSSHYFGDAPAAPTCSSSDVVSGLKDCVVTGYSTAVGTHTMSATATDNAGRTATATRTYEVKSWTFSGFYQPVDMGLIPNLVKGGSTVPLKFELFKGTTELTDTASVNTLSSRVISCGTLTGAPDDIELLATGGTSLRYDATGGQYIYNWQTPKGPVGTCYAVTLSSKDGSSKTAYFKLK